MSRYSPLSCQKAFFNETIFFKFPRVQSTKKLKHLFTLYNKFDCRHSTQQKSKINLSYIWFVHLSVLRLIHIHIHKQLDIPFFPIRQLSILNITNIT